MVERRRRRRRKTEISHRPEARAAYKTRFLAKLEKGNSPRIAAELCNISHTAIYAWRKDDADFLAAWEEAIQTGVDRVETALAKRAIKSSDRAAELYLKAYRPERYGRREESPSTTHNVNIRMTLEESRERLRQLGILPPVIEGDYDKIDAPADRRSESDREA